MFSVYVKFGERASNSPSYEKDEVSTTVRLGKLVICFAKVDIENLVHGMLSELRTRDTTKDVINEKEKEILQKVTEIALLKETLKSKEEEIDTLSSEIEDLENEIDTFSEEKELLERENEKLLLDNVCISVYYMDKNNT